MNKLQSDNLLNALCLHDNDNILITLKNLNSGMVLNEYGITMDAPALSGQKIARFDIQKDDYATRGLFAKIFVQDSETKEINYNEVIVDFDGVDTTIGEVYVDTV